MLNNRLYELSNKTVLLYKNIFSVHKWLWIELEMYTMRQCSVCSIRYKCYVVEQTICFIIIDFVIISMNIYVSSFWFLLIAPEWSKITVDQQIYV